MILNEANSTPPPHLSQSFSFLLLPPLASPLLSTFFPSFLPLASSLLPHPHSAPLMRISGLVEPSRLVCAQRRREGFPRQGLALPPACHTPGSGYVGWPPSVANSWSWFAGRRPRGVRGEQSCTKSSMSYEPGHQESGSLTNLTSILTGDHG